MVWHDTGCGFPAPIDNAEYPPTVSTIDSFSTTYEYACKAGFYDASGNNGTRNQLSCLYSSQSDSYGMDSVALDMVCLGACSCVMAAAQLSCSHVF